ncbi:hypothetical protein [Bradyrhizobium genosp. A]|uniref:hypothetical protein n=1 Tax=Bradyrhizobium genosp. A TaxID=83626 RepID=UPI003CEA2968
MSVANGHRGAKLQPTMGARRLELTERSPSWLAKNRSENSRRQILGQKSESGDGGRIVEQATAFDLFARPTHPYTQGQVVLSVKEHWIETFVNGQPFWELAIQELPMITIDGNTRSKNSNCQV